MMNNESNQEIYKCKLPLKQEDTDALKAGDLVHLSGIVYAARDAAHKRLIELMDKNEPLPFDLQDSVIYYVGPSPARPGEIIGSAGPTTSYRMDDYAPRLIENGMKGMIGKGDRHEKVIEAMKHYGSVYFAAVGGAGALLASAILSARVIAFDDLGAEAIRVLEIKDFPAIVVVDSKGNNLYQKAKSKYRRLSEDYKYIK